MKENDIVISGIAGRFPLCENSEEFWRRLISGEDLSSTTNDERWPLGFLGLPARTRRVKNIEKFDAEFFKKTKVESDSVDPQYRIFLEVAYEAIYDSGTILDTLKGSKTAVLIGSCFDDSLKAITKNVLMDENECVWCMEGPAVISKAFGFTGAVCEMDTACASSLSCLNEGFRMMQAGYCENLIVGGLALQLSPGTAMGFNQMNTMSKDGRSKCLDEAADGYCRAEAVVALFVQRRSKAKRIHASIISINTNTDGFKSEGFTFPGYNTQKDLLQYTISQSKIDPQSIEYFEAHITGTPAGDPIESKAIIDSYREKSLKPILFGCLKSNIGHTEGASANCSITKVAYIFQKHLIPPNLNLKKPNPNIKALIEKQIIPVIEKRRFDGEFIPVTSFGIGGVNVHALLKANEKKITEDSFKIISGFPRLVTLSNRTAEGINYSLEWIQANRKVITKEFLTLLNDVSKTPLETGMFYRGYAILDENAIIKRQYGFNEKPRELCFSFSTINSDCREMAKEFMHLKEFADSIYRSAFVLKSVNINLLSILEDGEPSFEEIEDSVIAYVVNVCIQIALVDFLKFIGIEPNKIVGFSIGAFIAGYCDNCFTAEEAILCTFYVSKYIKDNDLVTSYLKISYEQIATKAIPFGFYLSRDIRNDYATISGSRTKVKSFLTEMNSKDIFSKQMSIESFTHGDLPSELFENLVEELQKVIKTPKKRSKKWLTRSTNEYVDAKHFPQEIFSPDAFVNIVKSISKDACIVEIAHDKHLRSLIRKNNQACHFVPLFVNDRCTYIDDILSAVGEIYISGQNPAIEKLYPKVEYPVPRETAFLGHLLKWNHENDYFVPKYPNHFNMRAALAQNIDFMNEANFIEDHCIDGRNLFPATGYLFFAWKHFAKRLGYKNIFKIPIEFRNVKFHRAVILQKGQACNLEISIEEVSQTFVVIENGSLCVSGSITSPDISKLPSSNISSNNKSDAIKLNTKEIYKELRVRGYDYGPNFQGLIEANCDGSCGKIKWTGHWISFTDSMLQLSILSANDRNLRVPTFLEYMYCDARVFFKEVERQSDFEVFFDKQLNISYSNDIFVKGLKVTSISRRQDLQMPLLQNVGFIPYNGDVRSNQKELSIAAKYLDCCSRLLLNLREQNYKLLENDENEFNDPMNKKFWLFQKLKKFLIEKKDINEFVQSTTTEDREFFGFLSSLEDLLDLPVAIVTDNMTEKVINIIEFNRTSSSKEDLDEKIRNRIGKMIKADVMKCNYEIIKVSDVNKCLHEHLNNCSLIVIKHSTTKLLCEEFNDETEEETLSLVNSCYNLLKSGGFVLIYFRKNLTEFERQLFESVNLPPPKLKFRQNLLNCYHKAKLTFIGEKSDEFGMVSVLLRKVSETETLNEPIVIDSQLLTYDWIESIKAELKNKGENRIWIKAKESEINGVIGMTRCLRREPGCDRIRCIVTDIKKIPKDVLIKDLAVNVFKSGVHGGIFARKAETISKDTEHAFVDIKTKGDLSSFKWFEAPHKYWSSLSNEERNQNQRLVYIYYSALNFKDVMVASNRISSDAYPDDGSGIGNVGFEYSGIDENGDRVCGFSYKNAIATTLLVRNQDFVLSVPENLSLEEAVTIPVAYATVYYGLIIRAALKRNEKVLIHAGSGGVGQAAIIVCLSMGCEVFTSVGTKEKKEFLQSLFPQLQDKHFVNSRDVSFEEHILKVTNGRGVDVILNSLAEEKLSASINCLAEFGRFVEIGKYDLLQNNLMDLTKFNGNRTFHVVCVAQLLDDALNNRRKKDVDDLTTVMCLIKTGMRDETIKSLRRTLFNHEEIENAFRFMANGKHVGKVVIKIRDEDAFSTVPKPKMIKAFPQTYFNPSKVYLLIGGLGGIGIELAFWLVKRGAKKIVFTSRVGVKTAYQRYMIKRLKDKAVNVKIIVNDTSTREKSVNLFDECLKLGPISGIFNLAFVLSDALFENQTPSMFEKVCIPKIHTTMFLDQLSRELCPELDYFICFSSVIARGAAGQSNYGFANSAMEMICEKRREDGLHGVAIELGAVGDVGILVENFGMNKEIVIRGTIPQRINSCLTVLDGFINSSNAICSSEVQLDYHKTSTFAKGDLLKTICHILGVEDASILSDSITLGELGLDSLMAVEIQKTIERDCNHSMKISELRRLTLNGIRKLSSKSVADKHDESIIDHNATDAHD